MELNFISTPTPGTEGIPLMPLRNADGSHTLGQKQSPQMTLLEKIANKGLKKS